MSFFKIIRDVLLSLLSVGLIFFTFLFIISLLKYIGFSPSEWIEIIGAVIGVIGAYLLFTTETRFMRKKEKSDNAPRVAINNDRYNDCWFEYGYDFFEEKDGHSFSDNYTAYSDRYSNLTVPLINAGRTPIFNISIQMDIIDINNDLKKIELLDNREEINYELLDDNSVRIIEKGYKKNSDKHYPLKEHKYDGIPNLMPGQDIEIPLPMTYIKIIQYIVSSRFSETNYKIRPKIIRPFLKVTISFEDYDFKLEKKIFYITYDYNGYNHAFRKGSDEIRRTYLNLVLKSYPEEKTGDLYENEFTLLSDGPINENLIIK